MESGDIFDFSVNIIGSAVNSTNNNIFFTSGNVLTGQVISPQIISFQHIGFASLPSMPEPGIGAAECISIRRGNGDISIASRDVRDQGIYGQLGPGDTCLYARGSTNNGMARVSLKGDEGSITLSTMADATSFGGGAANTDQGALVYMRVDTTSWSFMAPWGSFVFDANGFRVQTANGGYMSLANVVAANPIVPAGSLFNVSAQSCSLDCNTVYLGPSVLNGGLPPSGVAVSTLPPTVPYLPIQAFGLGVSEVLASASTHVFASP